MLGEPGLSALEVFYSCAQADEPLRKPLEKQLKPLERQHLITGWHRGLIAPGVNHQQEAEQHLQSASLLLLLLSPDYITSDECYVEMERALDRSNAGHPLCVLLLLLHVTFDSLP